MKHPLADAIEAALDEIRPRLRGEGGDLELVAIDSDGTVSLRLSGAHACCPMALATLRAAVETYLPTQVPGVTKLVVTR